MADLCTVAEVKALAGEETGSVKDDVWAALIVSASDFIREYTRRDFATETYSEVRHGSGGSELFLRYGPANSITSLSISAVPIPAQTVDGGPGYFLDDTRNMLILCGYTFLRGRNNIRVSYPAGSDAIPSRIAQACRESVLWAFKRGKTANMAEQSLGPEGAQSSRWSMADIAPTARTILDLSRRVVPA